MKAQHLKDFLTEIVLTDSITLELRKEALKMRDAIDVALKNNEIETVNLFDVLNDIDYDSSDIEFEEKVFSRNRLRECHRRSGPKKIPFVKEVNQEFKLGLKEAKRLVDHLQFHEIFEIVP